MTAACSSGMTTAPMIVMSRSGKAAFAQQRTHNIHIGGGVSEAEFVKLRAERDLTLELPDRILHALQVNLRGGRLPEPESDGHVYFKIPANRF